MEKKNDKIKIEWLILYIYLNNFYYSIIIDLYIKKLYLFKIFNLFTLSFQIFYFKKILTKI